MGIDVLLGLQWGDEGKGKIVDHLATQYDVIARFQGGPNAGHTLKINGESFVLHTIPSGIFHDHCANVIGNGVVIDPFTLKKEINKLEAIGIDVISNLIVSNKAQLILPTHKALDAASEAKKGESKIGSTLRGIGPAYMDQTGRNGLRVGDIFEATFEEKYAYLKEKHFNLLSLFDYENDIKEAEEQFFEGIALMKRLKTLSTEYYINQALHEQKNILAEGAQGTMLDIDFGTYPFVTSSNTISAAACKGLGAPPTAINHVMGITKAYCTRVGSGPFPTELEDQKGEALRKAGNEFGATTGRPRRCGWIDLPALRYACLLNGVTQLIMTKVDILNSFNEIPVCTEYQYDGKTTNELPYDLTRTEVTPVYKTFPGWQCEIGETASFDELPDRLNDIVSYIESYLDVPVTIISNGPGREELVLKNTTAEV